MRTVPVIVVCLALVGCSASEPVGSAPTTVTSTTVTSTTVTSTTVTSTTVTSTTVTSTTVASTTSPPSTTPAAECPSFGGTADVDVGFPMTLSSRHGSAIDVQVSECVERIVIAFDGLGDLPGFWVHEGDELVPLGQTDDRTVDLRGDATLLVHVGAWMGEDNSLWGVRSIVPDGTAVVQQLLLADNSEGVMIWAVGLDRRHPFAVTVEADRLIVEVSTGRPSAAP